MQAGKSVQDKPERNCDDPAGKRRCTGDDTGPAALDLDDSIARGDRERAAQREKNSQSKNQIAHFFHLWPSNTNRLLAKTPTQKPIVRFAGPYFIAVPAPPGWGAKHNRNSGGLSAQGEPLAAPDKAAYL
jgi:hypothetical protein